MGAPLINFIQAASSDLETAGFLLGELGPQRREHAIPVSNKGFLDRSSRILFLRFIILSSAVGRLF
jgi:hypothetical protein